MAGSLALVLHEHLPFIRHPEHEHFLEEDWIFEAITESRRFFVEERKCDLLAAFRELRERGALEIIACAATHGLLPLIHQQSPEAARAQILIGCDVYREVFGTEPRGFWLPECGYDPR